jgi:predicted Zn-dependent protease
MGTNIKGATLRPLRQLTFCLGLLFAAASSVAALAGEISPGVSVRQKAYDAPINEQPYFAFAKKTAAQLEADRKFIETMKGAHGDNLDKAVDQLVEVALQMLLSGDYSTAAKRLNQAWLLKPDRSVIAHYFAFIALGQFDDRAYALRLMDAAAKLRAPLAELPGDHGQLLLDMKRPREAIPLLRKAIAQMPDSAALKANLALALHRTGQKKPACEAAAEAKGDLPEAIATEFARMKQEARC